VTSAATFDPWTATEDQARAATLREGHDPVSVHLVQGSCRLSRYLLEVDAPLRRWCVAKQVLELREKGPALVDRSELERASLLCVQHGMQPPRWLILHLLVRNDETASEDAVELGRRIEREQRVRLENLRERRELRAVWLLMRRYRWELGPDAPRSVLWSAIVNRRDLGTGGDLSPELVRAIRRLPMGKSKAQDLLAKAEVLLGEPVWLASHVPPPLT
jgi:hypothetical protein